MSSGKWYWETTIDDLASYSSVGVTEYAHDPSAYYLSYLYASDGTKFTYMSPAGYGAAYTTGDIIGCAYDADNGSLICYKNGSSQGTLITGLSGKTLFPITRSDGNVGMTVNFGQRAFAYTAPSGFKALNTANLPAPLVTKPNTVMDVTTYTGNGAAKTITGLAFSPDLVWMKVRSTAYNHTLIDSVRGATKTLSSSMTVQEYTEPTGPTAFTADGWSMSGDVTYVGSVNASGQTYVGWAWDAGTSTVTNTQGSITSSVRANATAGFSVCTFTQPSSSSSFSWGHGLGVAPELVFMKPTSASGNWQVYHKSTGAKYLWLNSTNAATGSGWSTVSSSVVTATATLWAGNYATVAYCFAPVVGYSSFGSYTGTGSDGPFVYCGFRPKFVMVKYSSGSSSGITGWGIYDAARGGYNVNQPTLEANLSDAEYTSAFRQMDFLSNGFMLRGGSGSGISVSGNTYVYAAFAESPFNYARAR
jgi:hypothetical protein